MPESLDLERAIAAVEHLRAELGEDVVEAALPPLYEKLAALRAASAHRGTGQLNSAVADQRKQVTILFAEISNFTPPLSDEAERDAFNMLWRELDAVILEHGGRIDKHIGRTVMGLWGADVARENDAEQAVRAALALQTRLSQIDLTPYAPNAQLRLRGGLNTGLVLLGAVGMTGEFTAIGDAVNLASRLQNAAAFGHILVAHDTFRQLRGLFDVVSQPPLKVKGKVEPIQTYLVERAKPRAFHLQIRSGIEGVETRMIGREPEMEALQTTFNQTLHDRLGQVVAVFGDEGLGKTRLLSEFLTWAEALREEWYIFQGRADETMTRSPFALWRDVFSLRFGLQDSDPLAVAREKLQSGMMALMPDEPQVVEYAHFIGHLLGLDFSDSPWLQPLLSDPEQLRERAVQMLIRFFIALTQPPANPASQQKTGDPVVLLLDDVHWADEDSLQVMETLFHQLAQAPIYVLILTRPTLLERFPHWGESGERRLRLTLKPLPREESLNLTSELLKKMPNPPLALQDLVVNGAEGNPFYVEELIKMLIDTRVIVTDPQAWRVEAERLDVARVPATLTGILQARLYNLLPEERLVLQCASVIGRAFWSEAVEALRQDAGLGAGASVPDALGGLRHKDLIFPRDPSAFAGSLEFSFKHSLLREVAYDTVLKRERPTYHADVANWLIAHSGERVNSYATQIAEHFERAGENFKAAEYFSRAAQQAHAVCAYGEAIADLERALRLLEGETSSEAGALQLSIEVRLGDIYGSKGNYAEAKKHLEGAVMLARARGDQRNLATALGQLGRLLFWQGDYEPARIHMEEALPLARALNDRPSEVFTLRQLGNIAFTVGAYDVAHRHYEESLTLARELNASIDIANALNALGSVESTLNRFAEALPYYEQALEYYRAEDDFFGVAMALSNVSEVHFGLEDYAASEQASREALKVSQQIGSDSLIMAALTRLGMICLKLDHLTEAQSSLNEGLRLCQTMNNLRDIPGLLVYYAQLRARQGQPLAGLELLGLIQANPATTEEDHRNIKKAQGELATNLTPADVDAALARGARMNLDQVVANLLAEA